MNFIKMIRKFVKILIGGSGSKEIYLAFLFGIILGLVPGFNLTTVILIALILLINVNLGTVFIAFFLGEILMYLLAPFTYNIGYFLIHSSTLNPLFVSIANAPVLALLGFDNYCLLGGVIIGLIIGLIFAWVFTTIVQSLRKALLVTTGNKTINKIAGNPVVKFLLRIIFGKQKANLEETLNTKSKFIRKGFFYPFIVFIIILIILDMALISPIAKHLIISKTEDIAGAEVNIESLSLSILRGKLRIEKLQITDATNPQNNLIYADDIYAQLNIMELLAKRIVAEKAILKGASIDKPRTRPGEVFSSRQLEAPTIELPDTESGKSQLPSVSDKILEKVKKSKKYIETIQKYYKIVSENFKTVKTSPEPKQSKSYSELIRLTSPDLRTEHPDILFKEIAGDSNAPYPLDFQILNLSTDPILISEPVKIFVSPKDRQANPSIELTLKTETDSDYIDVSIKELQLKNIKVAENLPYSLESAQAGIKSEGAFTQNSLDLPCTITLSNLQLDKMVNSNININTLKEITLYFNITGSLDKINIVPNHEKNVQSFKNILVQGTRKVLEDNLDNVLKDNNVKDIKDKVFDIFK